MSVKRRVSRIEKARGLTSKPFISHIIYEGEDGSEEWRFASVFIAPSTSLRIEQKPGEDREAFLDRLEREVAEGVARNACVNCS